MLLYSLNSGKHNTMLSNVISNFSLSFLNRLWQRTTETRIYNCITSVLRYPAASDTGPGRGWGTTSGEGTGRSSSPWSDKYSQDYPPFSKHDSGDAPKADNDIIIDDEIIVLGETSRVKNSEFVSCEITSDAIRPKPEQSDAAVRARARPVVLPSGSSVDLANSPHARIAPMVQQNRSRPLLVEKIE